MRKRENTYDGFKLTLSPLTIRQVREWTAADKDPDNKDKTVMTKNQVVLLSLNNAAGVVLSIADNEESRKKWAEAPYTEEKLQDDFDTVLLNMVYLDVMDLSGLKASPVEKSDKAEGEQAKGEAAATSAI